MSDHGSSTKLGLVSAHVPGPVLSTGSVRFLGSCEFIVQGSGKMYQ